MNDIKSRMKSVQSTMQITKAMELVATSKLRKAKERVEKSRPFYEILAKAICGIVSSCEVNSSVWSKKTEGKNPLYIVIAGDRGLAGGYNSNVFRLCSMLPGSKEAQILPIGKKAHEYYLRRNANLFTQAQTPISDVGVGSCLSFAQSICEAYKAGIFDTVILVYTKFKSMISQVPVYEELLPFSSDGIETKSSDAMFEGELESILDTIIPNYVGGIIYSAVCEALASESGARRSSMNAANKNAKEMIDVLMLKYNRARQAVITQEITEIVSGAEAL